MRSRFLFLVVLLLWAGLLLGVSFLATPIKFAAPHLTMAVALEVGVATFSLFNTVEWLMLCLAALIAVAGVRQQFSYLIVGLLGALMAIETFWLLPILHARAELVIAGGAANPGLHHWFYIAADVAKLAVLGAGVWILRGRVA